MFVISEHYLLLHIEQNIFSIMLGNDSMWCSIMCIPDVKISWFQMYPHRAYGKYIALHWQVMALSGFKDAIKRITFAETKPFYSKLNELNRFYSTVCQEANVSVVIDAEKGWIGWTLVCACTPQRPQKGMLCYDIELWSHMSVASFLFVYICFGEVLGPFNKTVVFLSLVRVWKWIINDYFLQSPMLKESST